MNRALPWLALPAPRLEADVARLAGPLARRDYAHPEVLARAADYVEERFRGAGGRVETDVYLAGGAAYRNVIARFGPAGGRPVVIGAHYDAAEGTPGADDNASGVAGLLALADRFQAAPPRLVMALEMIGYFTKAPGSQGYPSPPTGRCAWSKRPCRRPGPCRWKPWPPRLPCPASISPTMPPTGRRACRPS